MVKMKKMPGVSGPSSSIGIMRFFDADTKGPKLSPEIIIGATLVFIAVVLVAKMLYFS